MWPFKKKYDKSCKPPKPRQPEKPKLNEYVIQTVFKEMYERERQYNMELRKDIKYLQQTLNMINCKYTLKRILEGMESK